MDANDPKANPAAFFGNPNPPPAAPDVPAKVASSPAGPSTSAGTGALPPSNSAGSVGSPSAGSVSFSVTRAEDGTHEAYALDSDKAPQRLFTIRLPDEDVKKILQASGAVHDEQLSLYNNVPEDTVKALGQGRPTPVDYWKSLWQASEAESVAAVNGLQFLNGEKTREQLLDSNHLPTLQMQLAERPDMAWLGKSGIVAGFMDHPVDAAKRAVEKTAGTLESWAQPLAEVAKEAIKTGSGSGLAVGLVQPELAAPAFLVGATVGAYDAMAKMTTGQVAAHWAQQGLPDDVVKQWAPVAGHVNAAMTLGGFKTMSMLGKAAFIDALASSATAKRALAHWLVRGGLGGGAATGGVMAAQSAINSLLNNIVAEVSRRPDLLEDPKTAVMQALEAGLGGVVAGGALGAAAGGLGEVLRSVFKKLPAEEQTSPEGKKVWQSLKREEDRKVHDAVKEYLNPTEEPAPETKEPRPVGGPSPEKTPPGESERTPSTSEQPSQEKGRASTQEPASTSSNSSPKESIAENIKTLNAKTWYHGSGTPGLTPEKMSPNSTKIEGLFGHGIYLTDNPDVANSYADVRSRRTGTPTTYETKINVEKVLDMTAPAPPELTEALKAAMPNDIRSEIDTAAATPNASAQDVWRAATEALSQYSHDNGISSAELSEHFQELTARLREAGYDALQYEGGTRVGKVRHTALVMLDPNAELTQGTKNGEPFNSADRRGQIRSMSPTAPPPPAEPPPPSGGSNGAPEPEPPTGPRKYVKDQELGTVPIGDAKLTAQEVRQRYTEMYNSWAAPGNQLIDQLTQEIPKDERPGLRWWLATNGDEGMLKAALADPELEAVNPEIEKALNLSDKTKALAKEMRQYYREAGTTAQANGTIRNLVENYQGRLYKPDVEAGEKPNLGGTRTFGQNTPHAKPRVFDSEFDAARAGMKFNGDAVDALAIYNSEMSRINANRAVADGLVEQSLATWKHEAPGPGWKQVGTIEKQAAAVLKDGTPIILRYHLYAPEGLANGMRAITESDVLKGDNSLARGARVVQQAQGTVKTGLLSWSFFHHKAMLMQALYNGNWGVFGDLGNMTEHLNSPEFKEMELDAVGHGLETSMTHLDADVIKNLTDKEGPLADIANAPGVKQVLEQTDKNSKFLFGKMQRMFKVYDYANKISSWMADNPNATEAEITAAKREIARQVNPIYGGLNWKAMGVTPSVLSVARLAMLAPDWTVSGLNVLKQALTERGLAGGYSRGYIARALVAGGAATELMSVLRTGHTTFEGTQKHWWETEIAPNVWFSFFSGAIGEIAKIASMSAESGLPGTGRYAQGKVSPALSALVGLLYNVDYAGHEIVPKRSKTEPYVNPQTGRINKTEPTGPLAGTYDVLKWLLTKLTPTPIAITGLAQYLANEPDSTAIGATGVALGLGRYAKPPKAKKDQGGLQD